MPPLFYNGLRKCYSYQWLKLFNFRASYSEKDVEWADLIVIAGGDGTFLLGASLIRDRNKPIVGFNTNPGCSEGYLCLPKKYSFDVDTAVKKILKVRNFILIMLIFLANQNFKFVD